jgi:hypothetical protein
MVDTVAADNSCPIATVILLAGETKTSFIKPLTISSTVDEARFREFSNTVVIMTPESIYAMGFSIEPILKIAPNTYTKKKGKTSEKIKPVLFLMKALRPLFHNANIVFILLFLPNFSAGYF